MVSLLGLGSAGCASQAAPEGEGASSSALASSSNEHTAYSFFVEKGLSQIQSAAIVGNLMQESGVSPTIAQSGGPGRGIAQWSVGGRWDRLSGDNLHSFAASHGGSMTSLSTQLAFIWFELQNFPAYGLERLQNAATLSSAVVAFQTDFEVCGACDQSKRVKDAQSVLDAFGDEGAPVATDTSSGDNATPPGNTAPGNADPGTADPGNTAAGNTDPGSADPGSADPGSSDPGTDPGGSNGPTCYSATLDADMPANACVQSDSNGLWYQCSGGEWLARESVAAPCNGEYPL